MLMIYQNFAIVKGIAMKRIDIFHINKEKTVKILRIYISVIIGLVEINTNMYLFVLTLFFTFIRKV